MKGKKILIVLALLTFCLTVFCVPMAGAASPKTYDGTFDPATGIADYGTIWTYECADFEQPSMEWKPMQSEGYKDYSKLPGETGIYKSYNETYPSKILASGYIYSVLEDVAITFTAPENGSVTIDESVVRRWPYYDDPAQDGGDGVQIYILKNDKQIWPESGKQLIDKTLNPINTFTQPKLQGIEMKKGDKIRFCIHRGESNEWCDDTKWNPVVRFTAGTASGSQSGNNPQNNSSSQDNPKTGSSFPSAAVVVILMAGGTLALIPAVRRKRSAR